MRYAILETRLQKDFLKYMVDAWKSDSAKDMYVEESLENRLHVTKYLGLKRVIERMLVSAYSSI